MTVTTITLNPMLDKTVYIDRLARGRIHRAARMEMVAGGKGVNVARQLKELGVNAIATGFLGGTIGSMVAQLMSDEGIEHDFVYTETMTREGLTYLESDGTATAIFEPTGRIGAKFVHELFRKIELLAAKSAWIVCSGSSPGNEADDTYYEAIVTAHRLGIASVLDSYGDAFRLALKAMPTLVKPNRQELEQTFGTVLKTDNDVLRAMDEFLAQGIQYCIVSDGANPFYAAIRGHAWKITPPQVKAVNPIGSGDAMIAGTLYGFAQGWKFERCIAFGAAAGAANARKWSIANSKLQEIAGLVPDVAVRRIR